MSTKLIKMITEFQNQIECHTTKVKYIKRTLNLIYK